MDFNDPSYGLCIESVAHDVIIPGESAVCIMCVEYFVQDSYKPILCIN